MPPGQDAPPPDARDDARASAARANLRAAIGAFEAIGGFARAEGRPSDLLPPAGARDPAQDRASLEGTLCALRHLAGQFGGLSFRDALGAANDQYRLQSASYGSPSAVRSARMAAEAIDTCAHAISTPGPRAHRGGFWPAGTLSDLHGYASQHGLSLESAVTRLTTRLLTGLHHYADHQGIDFQAALAAGLRAHARQQLHAGGRFETGQDPAGLPAQKSQLPALASFEPTATNQGVVTSPADAEWLLIRTAARNQKREQHGLPARPRDADDQHILAEALAECLGHSPGEILSALRPQIAARVTQLELAPTAAAELGHQHGRTGAPPYCDLEIDGDATALMRALGETEPMTDENHQDRVSLVIAYATAYREAAGQASSPAESPARVAGRDFPGENPATQAGTPDATSPGRGQATPQSRPRPGPRPCM